MSAGRGYATEPIHCEVMFRYVETFLRFKLPVFKTASVFPWSAPFKNLVAKLINAEPIQKAIRYNTVI